MLINLITLLWGVLVFGALPFLFLRKMYFHFQLLRLVRPDEVDDEMSFFDYIIYKNWFVTSISNFFVYFPFYIKMENKRATGPLFEELEGKLKKNNIYLLCVVGLLAGIIVTAILTGG